jgi:sarcosine oxidase
MACARLVAQMPAEVEVAVVGAGLLGLAAARALARRGRQVTVLEQAAIGHSGAGSKGSCRIFRLGYPDPGYVAAARRSRDLWRQLETDCSRHILFPTPQLTFGAGLSAVRDAMLLAGAPCELLTAGEAAARFPGIAVGGPALLEPESAVTAASTALDALACAVPEIRSGIRVTGLADDGRRVLVRTDRGSLSARVAIICAGPWTAGLLGDAATPGIAAVPSAPTLEQTAYLAPAAAGSRGDQPGVPGTSAPQPPAPWPAAPGTELDLPIFIRHGAQSPYGLPVPGSPLYKIGIHPSGPPADPDRQDPAADPVLVSRLAGIARQHLPGLDPQPVAVERCVYDNSPDGDFILDRVGNVVIGCGTSGHGFKFGPLLGEWLAALAVGDAAGLDGAGLDGAGLDGAGLPAARFALGRFSRPGAGTGSP